MVDFQCKERYDYADLLQIMKILRAPGGCPWDGEQTHESIRRDFLEETCEAVEAIDRADMIGLCEELGDVLLQVVFHAQIETEKGGFTMEDVVNGICQKLVYRHPHVFGQTQVSGSDEVLVNWDALKRKEKGQATAADAVDAVATTLPGLWRAEKIQKKAAKAGFAWANTQGKLEEEVAELREAASSGLPADAPHGVREEVGDVLFMAVQIAREHGVDPEDALHGACEKFAVRFRRTEELANGALQDMTPEELAACWQKAKEQEIKS